MQQTRFMITISLLLVAGLMHVNAQQGVVSAGGQAAGDDGSVSYSIGQVFYHFNAGEQGAVAEGLQQPYEISIVTSIEEAEAIDLMFTAFPNPVSNMLTLDVKEAYRDGMQYQLLDFSGRLLKEAEIQNVQTSISMQELDPAVYFLRVLNESQTIKTFRIVKTQ